MRTVKMTALIGDSFERMAAILFQPFSPKKWMRLVLVALLAGMLFGGSGSLGGGDGSKGPAREGASPTAAQETKAAPALETKAGAEDARVAPGPEEARRNARMVVLLTVAAIAFVVFFLVFMTWIGARFKFVWLNAIIANTAAIREPYSRHRREGGSFFRLSLALLGVFLAALALVIGAIVYSMVRHGVFQQGFAWSPGIAVQIFLLPALGGIIFLIGFFIFAFLVDHFLVPLMAFDTCTASQGLKKLGAILRSNGKDVMLFILIFFLMSLAVSAVSGLLAILVFIALLVGAAVLFGVPFLLFWLLLKVKIVFIVYAVIVGAPFIVLSIAAMLAALLPGAVFFRVFSLNYLLSLDVGYGADTLAAYAARKTEHLVSSAPIILGIVMAFLLVFMPVAGILAAIAIPNFVRARQVALERKAATAKEETEKPQPASTPSVNGQP